MGIYNTIKYQFNSVVNAVKDTIWPYVVVYDNNMDVLIAGHHEKDASLIAEIIDYTFEEVYDGWKRVGKKTFEKIQRSISQTGKANLEEIIA